MLGACTLKLFMSVYLIIPTSYTKMLLIMWVGPIQTQMPYKMNDTTINPKKIGINFYETTY